MNASLFLYSFTQIFNPSYICGNSDDAKSKSSDRLSVFIDDDVDDDLCAVLLQFLLSGELLGMMAGVMCCFAGIPLQ